MVTESSASHAPDRTVRQAGDSARSRRRQASRRAAVSTSQQRRRLRVVYFSLASLWGFLLGTVALLFGFSLSGTRLHLAPVSIVAISAAILLAVVGGMIASRAYREASRRQR